MNYTNRKRDESTPMNGPEQPSIPARKRGDDRIDVLCVDDDPDVADATALGLGRESDRFVVETATDPSEGLDVLRAGDIDCVVSEHRMTGTSGLDFPIAVREQYPHLPIVLFARKEGGDVESEAIPAGVTDCSRKKAGTGQYAVLAERIEDAVEEARDRDRLERTCRWFRTLAERSSALLLVVDENGTVVYRSETNDPVLGTAPGETVGSHVFEEFVHPDDRRRASDRFDRLANDPDVDTTRLEFRAEDADGSWRQVEATASDRRDTLVEGFVVTIRDITDLKERERQFETLHEASQELMGAVTEPEIAGVTADAAENVLGYANTTVRLYDEAAGVLRTVTATEGSVSQAGERPDYDVDGDTPAARVFTSGEPEIYHDLTEVGDGYDRGGLVSGMYLPIGEHGVMSMGGTTTDAFGETDQRVVGVLAKLAAEALTRVTAAAELRHKNERLEEEREKVAAEREKLTLLNRVLRHHVLNGMAVVAGHAESGKARADPELRSELDVITDRVEDVVAFVENVRVFIDRIAGEGDRPLEAMDLARALEDGLDAARGGRSTTIAGQVPGDVYVMADELLPKAFEPLLANVLDHEEGNEQVAVSVDTGTDTVTVAIEDDGGSVPREAGADPFEWDPWHSSNPAGGVDLSLAATIVEQYGGSIRAETDEPGKAVFRVELPRAV